jgi:hypothetical protein
MMDSDRDLMDCRRRLTAYLGEWFRPFNSNIFKELSSIPEGPNLGVFVPDRVWAQWVITYLMVRHGRQDFRVFSVPQIREINFHEHEVYGSLSQVEVPHLVVLYGNQQMVTRIDNQLVADLLAMRLGGRYQNVVIMFKRCPELVAWLEDHDFALWGQSVATVQTVAPSALSHQEVF